VIFHQCAERRRGAFYGDEEKNMRRSYRGRSRLLAGVAALVSIAAAAAAAAGPVVHVPRGAPAVIDGRMDETEWGGSALQRLSDGTTIRLRHDGRHLFLGVVSSRQGFTSVCLAQADSIRIFHASAALGSVTYARSAQEWVTGEREFVYGMRNPDLSERAREERSAYLTSHGWLASTFRMGDGLVQELQFSQAHTSGMRGIGVAFFVASGDTGSVVTWPGTLALDDGCGNEKLVRGYVPPRLRFEPSGWVALTLDP
jgi:hypothetical protein